MFSTVEETYSTDGGANFSDVSGAGSVSGTTHTITGLTNGQAYNFRVIAIGSTSGAQTPGDYSEALTPAAASAPSSSATSNKCSLCSLSLST